MCDKREPCSEGVVQGTGLKLPLHLQWIIFTSFDDVGVARFYNMIRLQKNTDSLFNAALRGDRLFMPLMLSYVMPPFPPIQWGAGNTEPTKKNITAHDHFLARNRVLKDRPKKCHEFPKSL